MASLHPSNAEAYFIKAVPKDSCRLIAQQTDEAGKVLQLLVSADPDEEPPDCLHTVLQILFPQPCRQSWSKAEVQI